MITLALMRKMWPQGNSKIPGLMEAIVDTHEEVFSRHGIVGATVVAHFMAQISHECGRGTEVVENLNYRSPARLVKVWPKRFNMSSAVAYVGNPRKLANKVYNGRMGNRIGTDDGYNFRGRGGTQTTGRDGYSRVASATGLPLLTDPDLVNSPEHFLECAAADYVACGCLPYAKRDDIRGETQKLNGGQTNIADRQAELSKWKRALTGQPTSIPVSVMGDPGIEPETEKPKATGVLKYGDEGYEVRALQERLVELGYNVGNVDEDFGAGTRAAVLAFQADHNLDTDGIVGDETRDALRDDTNNKPISEARAAATEKALAAAGSQTIKASNKISLIGKVLAFLGISSGVAPVDQITEGVDKVHTLQPYMAALRGVGQWALTHWWIIVILVGLAIYFLAREIIDRRVADHISGANMGR